MIVGEQPLSTKVNYFIGRDPSKWRRNVSTYSKIRYRSVYPGIDLVYYGSNHRLEYDFDLAPGADASQILFAVKGTDAMKVDASGDLVLSKGARELRFQTPVLYQEINGARARVPGTYVLRDSTHVGFEVGSYDITKPLVIDPVLVYSTFLGGSGDDFSNGIAVDSSGDAYVVGLTDSPNFPASIGSYNPTQFRMFLTKLDPTGSSLLFANYFGGTSGGDEAYAVALDSSGNAFVTGDATSSDFPVVNAYQSFACSGAPAFSTCTVSPGSIIPGGNSSTVSVAVTTSGLSAQMRGVPAKRGGLLAYWLSSSLAVFGVLMLSAKNPGKSRRHVAAAVIFMLLLLVGCGGTGRSSVVSNTTPPGTYNLSVVATSGTLQHVTKLTLIVQ